MCSIMGYTAKDLRLEDLTRGFARTKSRGPDASRTLETPAGWLFFHRLAIMGLTESGMQPFTLGGSSVVCNGELYGFRAMRAALAEKGYAFESDSDCEILLPLYREYGVDMFAMLDAEFAMILYDAETGGFLAARDPIGIRPLYYGYSASGHILFASEPKNLVGLCAKIMPFPPGHYYKDGAFVCYCDIAAVDAVCRDDMETVCRNIREKLVRGIEKRLDADAPVGFLLSGGLDSSLVCAVAAKCLQKPIRTFAIGMRADAIDLKYAREVADYIHSDHTEIIITEDDVLENLETVIQLLGTFDITTIRASMGMYLICKAIRAQTDIRVLLTGEISDELFGYKYTDFAPSAEAFQQEAEKRVRELHMYDVLRADRCISRQRARGARPVRRPRLRALCHGDRPGDEAQQIPEGQVPSAPRLRGRLSAAVDPVPGEGRVFRRGRPLDGRPPQGVCRNAVHRRRTAPARRPLHARPALHEGVAAVPGNLRKVLPGAGGNDRRLLDAEPRVGRLRCR